MLRILVLLLVLVAIVALAWVRLFGFPDSVEQRFVDELNKKGVPVRFGRIYFDPFQGFVAGGAFIFNPNDRSQQLVSISEIGLKLNYDKLRERALVLEELRIEDATLSLPLDLKRPQESTVTGSNVFATARVEGGGNVTVENASGVFNGVRVQLSGSVAFGSNLVTSVRAKPNLLARVFQELETARFSETPEISGRFHLDLARPELCSARVQAKCRAFTHNQLQVDSVSTRMVLERQVLRLQEFDASLYGGKISVKGEYDWTNGVARVDLRSDVDVKQFVEASGSKASGFFRDYEFTSNPILTAKLEGQPGEIGLSVASGIMEASQFSFRRIPIQSFRSRFTLRDGLFRMPNFEGRRAEGLFQGTYECQLSSEDFTLDMVTTVHPAPCRFVFPKGTAEWLTRFRFEKPPQIAFREAGNWRQPELAEIKIHAHADQFAVDGVPMESLDADATVRGRLFSITNCVLKRKEGEVTGHVEFDGRTGTLVGSIVSTANPYEVAKALGTNAVAAIKPYEFLQPPKVAMQGRLNFQDPTQTDLTGHIEGEHLYWWRLNADGVSTDITIRDRFVALTNFSSKLYGGRLEGDAEFSIGDTGTRYHINARLDKSDLQQFSKALTKQEQKSTGQVSGRVNVTGVAGDFRSIDGDGTIAVENGILWEHRVFGELLSGAINTILPGRMATSTATEARGEFILNRGVAEFSQITVNGGMTSIVAKGRYKLWSGGLDFEVEGRPWNEVAWAKLVTWIPGLFTKLFTMHLGGTWAEPEWRTVYLPKELMAPFKSDKEKPAGENNNEAAPPPHSSSSKPQ
jgi:molybdopterin-binding protein